MRLICIMNLLKTAIRYISYYFNANSLHGTHSPFVYELVEKVIYDKTQYPDYVIVENQRIIFKKDERKIVITDYGAGSLKNNGQQRKISDIATDSLKPAKYGQLIYRLVRHIRPATMIELGTSLGITTSYMALAYPEASLITMEGCPNTLAVTKKAFEINRLNSIRTIEGNFDETFPVLLDELDKVDLVFFDGNHRKQATLDYFYKALQKAHEGTLFIFDDIYWSDEMKEAWEEIKLNEKVSVTIDLFFIGLVFFRKEQEKEDFVIRY